jgi:hypothetical protein
MLQVIAAWPCCMSKVPVNAECTSCILLLLHAACTHCISLLHVLAVLPCYMSVLHAHVNVACPYCMSCGMSLKYKPRSPCSMSLLNVHAACPCFMLESRKLTSLSLEQIRRGFAKWHYRSILSCKISLRQSFAEISAKNDYLFRFGEILPKSRRNKPLFSHFVSTKFRFGEIFRFGGNPTPGALTMQHIKICSNLKRKVTWAYWRSGLELMYFGA